MDNLIGRLTAELAEKETAIPDGLLEKLNRNINPPEPLTAEQVHMRAMYILSDQVNSFGGCFPVDEHEKLAALIIDSPVLVGHRKDSLPIARNFHAERVRRGETNWVKVYFYWLKNSETGEEILKNIDGGIYKECSISFIFSFPECTICGKDMRECRHQPFAEYDLNGAKETAYFNYRRIEKVLETSLVYRGSVENTALTKELAFSKGMSDNKDATAKSYLNRIRRIWELGRLCDDGEFLVLPGYESLAVKLIRDENRITVTSLRDERIESPAITEFLEKVIFPSGNYVVEGRLIGYRGKERRPAAELCQFLRAENSPVRRLDLKVCDLIEENGIPMAQEGGALRRRRLEKIFEACSEFLVPARQCSAEGLKQAIEKFATRSGAEIYSAQLSERYLFSYGRTARFAVSGKEKFPGGYRYQMTGIIGDTSLAVKNVILSASEYDVGEVCEVDSRHIRVCDGVFELKHPKIIASLGKDGDGDDLIMVATPITKEKSYSISILPNADAILDGGPSFGKLRISNFSLHKFHSGRIYRTEKRDDLSVEISGRNDDGTILSMEKNGDGYRLSLGGYLQGDFIIRPVRINGKRKHIIYRLPQTKQKEG